MWRNVGIERTGDRLDETREIIAFWSRYVMDKTFDSVAHAATPARGRVGIAEHADGLRADHRRRLHPHESRGAHYRLDYPDPRRRPLAAAPAVAPADGDADSGAD